MERTGPLFVPPVAAIWSSHFAAALVSSGGTSAGRSAALSVVAQVQSKSGGIVPIAAVEAALVDSPPELGGGTDEPDPPHAVMPRVRRLASATATRKLRIIARRYHLAAAANPRSLPAAIGIGEDEGDKSVRIDE